MSQAISVAVLNREFSSPLPPSVTWPTQKEETAVHSSSLLSIAFTRDGIERSGPTFSTRQPRAASPTLSISSEYVARNPKLPRNDGDVSLALSLYNTSTTPKQLCSVNTCVRRYISLPHSLSVHSSRQGWTIFNVRVPVLGGSSSRSLLQTSKACQTSSLMWWPPA